MKTSKILILALILTSFSFLSCPSSDSSCQITYYHGINRVECGGECPSANAPECYVRFRKEGSTNDWEKSGQPRMDKTPGMEFSCYCDTALAETTIITEETEEESN